MGCLLVTHFIDNYKNMHSKIVFAVILVLIFRSIDLYTTYLSCVDFEIQETNLIVKMFTLNFVEFCIFDYLLTIILIINFTIACRQEKVFKINTNSFKNYMALFFFKNIKLTFFDFLNKMSVKNCLILFGDITPKYVVLSSTLFSINNIWVYLYMKGNLTAVKYYNFLNSYYFFDIVIFVVPIIILIFLALDLLYKNYRIHNLSLVAE